MNKPDNKLALSVLATLTAGIALIYTLIMYHNIIFAVAGMSVLFLITAFILTQNIIIFSNMKSKSLNVHIKDCVDDISAQLENINGAQSQIGKATYVYTKQAAQTVATLENNYAESQEALYKNLASISNAQNKATKLLIKYDQSNTTKVLAGIKDMRNKLNETMIQGFDQIQPNNSEVVTALEEIVSYLKTLPSSSMDQTLGLQLNNVAHELQNISSSIQHVQIPVTHTSSQAILSSVPQNQPVETPAMETTPISTQIEQPVVEENVTPMKEQVTVEENVAPIEEAVIEENITPIEEQVVEETITPIEEQVVEETIAPIEEQAVVEEETKLDELLDNIGIADEQVKEVETEPSLEVETSSTAEITEEPKETPTIADVSGDSNKMLTADEIAALFATSEPAPKKEPVKEESFTPTFTVVGKSDEEEAVTTTEPIVSDDPNKQLSADEIAALFAAADPAPKQETKVEEVIAKVEEPVKVEPVSDDPNKQLSADEIAALFAAADPSPKKEEVAEKAPEPPKVEPISDDPNKQLSADEIAALFASIG